MWDKRWKYRREFGVPEKPLKDPCPLRTDVSVCLFVKSDVHITEIDGITPLKVDSIVKLDDDGAILWIEKPRGDAFYIYYDKHFLMPWEPNYRDSAAPQREVRENERKTK